MSNPRKANVSVQYNGKNVTTKLTDYLSSFSYTDVASGESDSITFKLSNIDKRWITTWLPVKGDKIIANIITQNWSKDGDKKTFKCGSFTIDDLSFSGPQLSGNIGAVSIPAMESFKATERTKTWKSVTIESIAIEIAKRSKIKLIYTAGNIKINSIEQSNQTDCSFLYELCESYGLAMKVYSDKIVIFDESTYENKKSVVTIKASELLTWNYNTKLTRTYTGAEIKYTNASTDKDIKIKVGTGNRILKINEKADNLKDAELKAMAKVNNANKKMTTMKITIKANTKIVASSNIRISGLGKLDGKYAVDKVTHTIGTGYTMKLDLRLIQNRIGDNTGKTSTSGGTEYTIVRGDTLWDLSKKHLGSGENYMQIYNANKEIIEAAAKKHGLTNSSNGYYIYPGTKIIIPS